MSSRPLVVRFGAFGDMIMMAPFLERIRQRYGRAPDVVTSGSWSQPLLSGRHYVHELHLLKSRKSPYWASREQQRLVKALRPTAPRPVYVCDDTPKTTWLMRRAGFGANQSCLASDLPWRDGEHQLEYWARFAELTPPYCADAPAAPVAHAVPDLNVSIDVDDADVAECLDWLQRHGWSDRPLVLVQPGNKRTMRWGRKSRASNTKFWAESRWADVIRRVSNASPDARIVFTGSPQEANYIDRIRGECAPVETINAAHELPVRRLLALLCIASGMISVDTGPAHAAAAVNCPLVVLIERSKSERYRPVSSSSPVATVLPDAAAAASRGIAGIEPDAVYRAWRSLFAGGGCALQLPRDLVDRRRKA